MLLTVVFVGVSDSKKGDRELETLICRRERAKLNSNHCSTS